MSGNNRKSSYQIAMSIATGELREIDHRTLKFLAAALLKVREREQAYKLELELARDKLARIDFRQHELSSVKAHLEIISKRYRANRLRRTQQGLPEDAIPAPFALFGWKHLPIGGWSDCLGLFASKAEAQKRKQELRQTQWTHLHIVDVRSESLR